MEPLMRGARPRKGSRRIAEVAFMIDSKHLAGTLAFGRPLIKSVARVWSAEQSVTNRRASDVLYKKAMLTGS
jgi:hypothetical protein